MLAAGSPPMGRPPTLENPGPESLQMICHQFLFAKFCVVICDAPMLHSKVERGFGRSTFIKTSNMLYLVSRLGATPTQRFPLSAVVNTKGADEPRRGKRGMQHCSTSHHTHTHSIALASCGKELVRRTLPNGDFNSRVLNCTAPCLRGFRILFQSRLAGWQSQDWPAATPCTVGPLRGLRRAALGPIPLLLAGPSAIM